MLLQFTLKNFKSFKDQAVLSLEGSKSDKAHPDNYVTFKTHKCLKSAAIFGQNAAGKSNIFKALTAAIVTIRRSNTLNAGEAMGFIVPFMFDEATKARPTGFEFVFTAEGKKYVYRFEATAREVISEALFVYNTKKPQKIFERTGRVFKYTEPTIKTELEPVERLTGENKLFLSTAAAYNCKSVQVPFSWFANGINTYAMQGGNLFGLSAQMYEKDEDHSLHDFTNKLLRWADINIDDFEFYSQEVDRDKFVQNMPPEVRSFVLATNPTEHHKLYELYSIHRFSGKNGEITEYKMPFVNESAGTERLFELSPVLKRAFESGETVCVDELDTSLHPMLIKRIVRLFSDPEVNKANAQLVFSAHTAELLDLEDFRRDQIYFVTKDRESCGSSLASLDDFKPVPRKTDNIRRNYLNGRYNAVPDVTREFRPWEAQ